MTEQDSKPDYRPLILKPGDRIARRYSREERDALLAGNKGVQRLRRTVRRDGAMETIVSFYYMPDGTRYKVTDYYGI